MTINLTALELSYLAGFIDADGSINAQLIYRADYILKYQIRVSVTLYQLRKRRWFLISMQKKLGLGTLRDRNDGMSELNIIGAEPVQKLVKTLLPFLKIKHRQAILVISIIERMPKDKEPLTFYKLCQEVDKFEELNDSKKRKITSVVVAETLGLVISPPPQSISRR